MEYSKKQIDQYIDSISNLNLDGLAAKINRESDSIFHGQTELHLEMNLSDFVMFKKSCAKGKIETNLVKRLFPEQWLDSSWIEQAYVPINVYQFGEEDFRYYAVEIPVLGSEESIVYFACSNKIISKHNIEHRYGLEISYFYGSDKFPVVYYSQCYLSGTDVWWFSYNFYKFTNTSLLPVLNTMSDSHFSAGSLMRSCELNADLVSENPLKLKLTCSDWMFDGGDSEIYLVKDSSVVQYRWDEVEKRYFPDFRNSKFNDLKILAHTGGADLLFIKLYHNELKAILKGDDKRKMEAVLKYLSALKN